MFRYGKWGYGFGRSPFNVSQQEYEQCVDTMRFMPLDQLYYDFEGVDEVVQHIIRQYSCLDSPTSPG